MKTVSDNILEEVVKNVEFSNADILRRFYVTDEVSVEKGKLFVKVKEDDTRSARSADRPDAFSGKFPAAHQPV